MKTMTVLLGMLLVCTFCMAQQHADYPKLKPGVIFITQTPEGEWIADGFQPPTAYAISTVNEVYLFPLDGSGPIPINDPTAVKRINPYLNFIQDGIDPGPGPWKRKVINPNYLIPIDKFAPTNFNPTLGTGVNPSFVIPED